MKTQTDYLGVSQKDIEAIESLINDYGHVVNQRTLIKYMEYICENITPAHYMVAGYLIGEKVAAFDSDRKIQQILSLCQRQN